ncbi:hypothetical protein AKJ08_1297 [Vulgatibacter incomptus]|uniref:Uncharacterized protein n=1 Tax=Vulgatibacter incomptus TaxID=1391653 RepID=A0A0K1PBK9_9BACT|nr:hypothetical protein AKJ08_1297 [Vulgatibacter incomptus]
MLLMAGTGFPEFLHVEVDVALARYLAVTGRVGALPPVIFEASAGLLGLLPLSADTALIPRHALGLGVELSTMSAKFGSDLEHRSEDLFPDASHGPTVSAGYLYTSRSGFHVRVMAGAFLAMWGHDDQNWLNLRVSLGGLL